MANFNLVRNSRVFFTTNVNATTGKAADTLYTTTNSQELTILDGFSFSQTTNADTVTLNEAGTAPARGQRSFNTSLNPVDFSFSTYIRPNINTTVKAEEACLWNALFGNVAIGATLVGATVTGSATCSAATYTAPVLNVSGPRIAITMAGVTSTTTAGSATGSILLVGEIVTIKGAIGAGANVCNAPAKVISAGATIVLEYLSEPASVPTTTNFASAAISFVRSSWVENAAVAADTGYVAAYTEANVGRSNINQLLPFALMMTVDNITYAIDNCVMDQATIDFGLDGIAMVQWTGKASGLRQTDFTITYGVEANPVITGIAGTATTAAGTIAGKLAITSTKFITNKLSTVALISKLYGTDGTTAGDVYTIALTGGSLTIANNVNFITPANIGVVNKAFGYYTGTRSITGSLNAYLKTGTLNSAALLDTLLDDAGTAVEPKYSLTLSIGGANNPVRVDCYMPGCNIQIPTVDAQAVLSTVINFTAEGVDDIRSAQGYDIELPNELRVRYFAA
jgi:hypothetical protein